MLSSYHYCSGCVANRFACLSMRGRRCPNLIRVSDRMLIVYGLAGSPLVVQSDVQAWR